MYRISVLVAVTAILGLGCRSVVVGDSVGVTIPADANYAVPGATISDLTRQLETDPAVRVVVRGSDLTISVGGNDIQWFGAAYLFSGHWGGATGQPVWIADEHDEGILRTATATFRADWLRMADVTNALAPRHVTVLTIYNPFVSVTDAMARRYLRELNDWIATSACARGWLPARVDVAFNGDGSLAPGALLGPDGMHPSAEGQAAIEREIQNAHC